MQNEIRSMPLTVYETQLNMNQWSKWKTWRSWKKVEGKHSKTPRHWGRGGCPGWLHCTPKAQVTKNTAKWKALYKTQKLLFNKRKSRDSTRIPKYLKKHYYPKYIFNLKKLNNNKKIHQSAEKLAKTSKQSSH